MQMAATRRKACCSRQVHSPILCPASDLFSRELRVRMFGEVSPSASSKRRRSSTPVSLRWSRVSSTSRGSRHRTVRTRGRARFFVRDRTLRSKTLPGHTHSPRSMINEKQKLSLMLTDSHFALIKIKNKQKGNY